MPKATCGSRRPVRRRRLPDAASRRRRGGCGGAAAAAAGVAVRPQAAVPQVRPVARRQRAARRRGGGAAARQARRAAGGGGPKRTAARRTRQRGAAASDGRARPQVLAHRTIPAADRQGRAAGRQRQSRRRLDRPADVAVDSAANEVYVADGGDEPAHRRVRREHGRVQAAVDADTAPTFGRLSCVALSKDGQVYVCDRKNNRIQVFKKDGTFVKEGIVSKTTTMHGSVWDIAFSSDAAQRYLFVADGQDEKDLHARSHVARDAVEFRRRRRLAGRVPARRQRRHGLEGQPVHG